MSEVGAEKGVFISALGALNSPTLRFVVPYRTLAARTPSLHTGSTEGLAASIAAPRLRSSTV
jgi:hypothetical protein